jgi:hypothetical protein
MVVQPHLREVYCASLHVLVGAAGTVLAKHGDLSVPLGLCSLYVSYGACTFVMFNFLHPTVSWVLGVRSLPPCLKSKPST